MRIQEVQLYQFEELSDTAKEKARDWWRRASEGDNLWSESVIEDAIRMGELLGITFKRTPDGEAMISWSGFSSQGDGASFEGGYTYTPGSAVKIAGEAPADASPQNAELCRIACELEALGPLSGTLVRMSHHYSHDRTVTIEVDEDEDGNIPEDKTALAALELLRDFMRWIYRGLEMEYEYSQSAEVIDELLVINEYEFHADGRRACV